MACLVAWPQLSPQGREAVRSLAVSERQAEYAGAIEAAVAQAEAGVPGELVGLAILAHEDVVGFLLLKSGAKAPEWAAPGSAVISALRIDARCQGQGHATRALQALPAWIGIHWPSVRSLALSVDEENAAAARAYAKAGWVDHGVRVRGRIGWVRYMSRSLP